MMFVRLTRSFIDAAPVAVMCPGSVVSPCLVSGHRLGGLVKRNCQDLWIGVLQATSVPACWPRLTVVAAG